MIRLSMLGYDRAVLSINPWDMDDSDFRVLDNRMVTTRVTHDCSICWSQIPSGVRVRALRETCDGTAKTFYFCRPCCMAMALKGAGADKDGDHLSRRYDLGRHRAELARAPLIEDPADHDVHQWEGEGGR